MSNKYDRKFLEQHLHLFEFGQCERTGHYDIASPEIDMVCPGLTKEQVEALSEWSWKTIGRIMERFDSIREEQSKPTKSPTINDANLRQCPAGNVYTQATKQVTKHPELDSNQRPAD